MSRRSISNVVLHNASAEIGNGVEQDVSISNIACIEVVSEGTFTVIFEGKSLSNNWYELSGKNVKTLASSSSATASGLYLIDLSGITVFRVRLSVIGAKPVTVNAKFEG